MILTNITNQSVAIFFSVFPNLNNGLKHPIYFTIPSLLFNIISVALWVCGEKNESHYEIQKEEITNNDVENKEIVEKTNDIMETKKIVEKNDDVVKNEETMAEYIDVVVKM